MLHDDFAPHYPVCYRSGESRPRLDLSGRKALYGKPCSTETQRGEPRACAQRLFISQASFVRLAGPGAPSINKCHPQLRGLVQHGILIGPGGKMLFLDQLGSESKEGP